MKHIVDYRIIAKIVHWLIMAVCIYTIGCSGFHFFPPLGVSDDYETINSICNSIALSYIAGYVIYLLTSVLPQKQREKEVFSLWFPHLSNLYNEMSERIEELRVFAGIPKEKMASLSLSECERLGEYANMPGTFSAYCEAFRDDPNNPLRLSHDINLKRTLNGHSDRMESILAIMLDNPMAIDANKRLLDILSQIRSSKFLKQCQQIIGGPIESNGIKVSIHSEEFPSAYIDYVALRDRLGLYPINKYLFSIRVQTSEEVEESRKSAREALAQMGLTLEQEQEIAQRIARASKKQ